jgi:hypothetical protein
MEEKEEVAELDEEVNGDDESSAYFSKAADHEKGRRGRQLGRGIGGRQGGGYIEAGRLGQAAIRDMATRSEE